MGIERLIIKPFEMTEILECRIKKQINDHFELFISGYISGKKEDYFNLSDRTEITVETEQDNSIVLLFKGILCTLSIYSEGDLNRLDVTARSYTCLLDYEKKIQVFQDEAQTYKSIVKQITEQMEKVGIIYAPETREKHCNMVVQYEETSWEFLKRLASHLNTVIIPDCINSYSCFYFGVTPKKEMKIEESIYKRTLMVLQDRKTEEYCFESKTVWELCTQLILQGRRYLIYEIETRLEKGEILHRYRLRSLEGFRTERKKNIVIAGNSLKGEISCVKEERVKVIIHHNNDFRGISSIWFPYATVYSSPGGEGWYCMPEEGDTIRLYFPDEEEKNAYVVSAVHLGAVDEMRSNPNEKSIRTIYDKEIRLTSSKIILTNHKGMSITLDDKKRN